MNILEIDHLSKSFGAAHVIRDLTFAVPEHTVFGFVGRNGAGKTTTMKMILGFMRPSAGTIRIAGEPVRYGSTPTNRFIGYLPDVPEFYGYLSAREYLRLCGRVVGLNTDAINLKSTELLGLVGLDGVKKRIGSYSRGMKQRLGVAQALMNDPRILICDEPTSALDPAGRRDILEILAQAKTRTTVLFSTHILSDVEAICDAVGVLNDGVLALEGNLELLKAQRRTDTIELELADESRIAETAKLLKRIGHVDQVSVAGAVIQLLITSKDAATAILSALLAANTAINRFEVLEPTLEDIFLETTGPEKTRLETTR